MHAATSCAHLPCCACCAGPSIITLRPLLPAGWPLLSSMAGKVVFMAFGDRAYEELMHELWPDTTGSPVFWEADLTLGSACPRLSQGFSG